MSAVSTLPTALRNVIIVDISSRKLAERPWRGQPTSANRSEEQLRAINRGASAANAQLKDGDAN